MGGEIDYICVYVSLMHGTRVGCLTSHFHQIRSPRKKKRTASIRKHTHTTHARGFRRCGDTGSERRSYRFAYLIQRRWQRKEQINFEKTTGEPIRADLTIHGVLRQPPFHCPPPPVAHMERLREVEEEGICPNNPLDGSLRCTRSSSNGSICVSFFG